MPLIFVHGVTVRQPGIHVLAEKVQSKLIAHGIHMPFQKYFWGGGGVALRWGGDSIPGISAEERRNQIDALDDSIRLPDLKQFLIASPLMELNAWRETRTFADFDGERAVMNDRRARLDAAKALLVAELTSALGEASLRNVVSDPDGSTHVFLTSVVTSCLDAAARTQVSQMIPDLFEAIKRSLTASIYTHLVPAAEADTAFVTWDIVYESVSKAVEKAFKSPAGLFGDLLKNTALSLALPLFRGTRGSYMPPTVRFLGDVFVYLSNRATFLEGMHAVVTQALDAEKENKTPLWIVAHSLGGVISFDYCTRYGLPVERLVTVGSQTGLFAEGDLLFARHPDEKTDGQDHRPRATLNAQGKRNVPKNVKRWINIYDLNDMMSFRCDPIFNRVSDFCLDSGTAFPESHSAYWDRDKTYQLMLI